MPLRHNRLTTLFKKLTADFLKEEAPAGSIVTVTDFALSPDCRGAAVLLSVYPEGAEVAVLRNLRKKEKALKKHFSAHTKTKTVPVVRFGLDKGERNRRHIEALLGKPPDK